MEAKAEPEEETEGAAFSAGTEAAAVGGATASASPFSGAAVGGGATRDASDGPLHRGATGEDDDLPSFFPAGGEALSPSELEGGSPGVAAAREPDCEESAAHGRAAQLPSGADAEQLGGVEADGRPRPSGLAQMGPPRAHARRGQASRRMASSPLLPSRSSAATSSTPCLAPRGTQTFPTRCPWTPTPTAGWRCLSRRLPPQTARRTPRLLMMRCPRMGSRAPDVEFTVLRHGGTGLVPGVAARSARPQAGGAGGLLKR